MERLDEAMSVREGRDRDLAANGFSTDDCRKPWFHLNVLGAKIPFPNPPSRRKVVPRFVIAPRRTCARSGAGGARGRSTSRRPTTRGSST